MNLRPEPPLTSFHLDPTAHELRRRASVLGATPDWDPAAALADEARAHEMLCSGLDTQQQAVLAQLRAAGIPQ